MTSKGETNKEGVGIASGVVSSLMLTVRVCASMATVIASSVLSKVLMLIMVILNVTRKSIPRRLTYSQVSLTLEVCDYSDKAANYNIFQYGDPGFRSERSVSASAGSASPGIRNGTSGHLMHSTPRHHQAALSSFPAITPVHKRKDEQDWNAISDWSTSFNDDSQSEYSDRSSEFEIEETFDYLSISDRASDNEFIQHEIRDIRSEISQISEDVMTLNRRKDDITAFLTLIPNPLNELATYDVRDVTCSTDSSLYDYMWDDYETGVKTQNGVSSFTVFHPGTGSAADVEKNNLSAINYNCSTFDHVRLYMESCCGVFGEGTLDSGSCPEFFTSSCADPEFVTQKSADP